MTIRSWCLGPLQTNSHVVSNDSGECWIVDCPPGPEPLLLSLQEEGLRPQGVFLTHAHGDHMGGLTLLRERYPNVEVWIHPDEAAWLEDPEANLSAWMGQPFSAAPATGVVREGDELMWGLAPVRVLHLPGHSPGSVAYWLTNQSVIFSGDVLFRGGVGRWDLPGGSAAVLRESLKRLVELSPDTQVFPGHGDSTTIGQERSSNPYLLSPEEWE